MRRTLIGLAAAGLLLVSACSDSDSGGPDEEGGGSEDAATEGESGEGGSSEGFCADFQALNEQFANDPEAQNDPNAVIQALEGLEPPDEIAEDFTAVIDVMRQTADVDMNDPDAVAEAQELTEQSAESQEAVSVYIEDECDLQGSGGG